MTRREDGGNGGIVDSLEKLEANAAKAHKGLTSLPEDDKFRLSIERTLSRGFCLTENQLVALESITERRPAPAPGTRVKVAMSCDPSEAFTKFGAQVRLQGVVEGVTFRLDLSQNKNPDLTDKLRGLGETTFQLEGEVAWSRNNFAILSWNTEIWSVPEKGRKKKLTSWTKAKAKAKVKTPKTDPVVRETRKKIGKWHVA